MTESTRKFRNQHAVTIVTLEKNIRHAEVLFEEHETHAKIILNRPNALNAMTPDMVDQINAALDLLDNNTAKRVILISAMGRAFCVGADLKGASERSQSDGKGPTGTEIFLRAYNDLLNRIEALPIPVITALNGMTMGAGLELALASDVIVASSAARIGDGHAKFGLLPGGGASARLPRRIGEANAKWMFFNGDFLPNEDLMRFGLLQAVYPEERFEDEVNALLAKIASRSPIGLKRLKELANNATHQTLLQALDAEQEMMRQHMASKDRAEGLAAFEEKRTPNFTGE